VLPAFEERFTVLAVDRRGRGGSDDDGAYAIEREFEDLAAVADHAGEGACVLGHSFGAICALEAPLLARLLARPLRALVLYEPPVNTWLTSDDVVGQLEGCSNPASATGSSPSS
jgi:pimeloyl-ACP methyl ester carboxylesterase